jgi:hypothetical protein
MGWEDVANYMQLAFSVLYMVSNIHSLGVLWRFVKGDFKGMGFLRKMSYMLYLMGEPALVVEYNG